jgi:hypothetical protein
LCAIPVAAQPAITGHAGLAGVGRAFRWTPVRLTVESGATDIDGRLSLVWGQARVERSIALGASMRRHFELYIRTTDPRDVITARVETAEGQVGALDIPIKIVSSDDHLVVCAPGSSNANCSIALAPEDAPSSWRGYDAADEVLGDSRPANLSVRQRHAISLWTALRGPGTADPIFPADLPPQQSPYVLKAAPFLGIYIGGLTLVAGLARLLSRRVTVWVAMMTTAITAGTVAAIIAGHSSPIVIHHASVMHEFEDVTPTWAQLRGVATFPNGGQVALRGSAPDGIIQEGTDPDDAQLAFDSDGRPLLVATVRLGDARPFVFEAEGSDHALQVVRVRGGLEVTNVSRHDLRDCQLPSGFSPHTVATLPQGTHVQARGQSSSNVATIECTFDGPPLDLDEAHADVLTHGRTMLVHHLRTP